MTTNAVLWVKRIIPKLPDVNEGVFYVGYNHLEALTKLDVTSKGTVKLPATGSGSVLWQCRPLSLSKGHPEGFC